MRSPAQQAIFRLQVRALEDITESELEALLQYIKDLEDTANRYDNVMNVMAVEYEDMFPDES